MQQDDDWTRAGTGPVGDDAATKKSADGRFETGPLTSGVPAKADLGKRLIAGLIDGVLAGGVSLIPGIGGIIAAAYMLVRDGLEVDFMPRRSIGKKVMELKPVRLDGAPVDLQTSAMRNWMFALGGVTALLVIIPVIGWLLMIPVGLAALGLVIVEIVLVLTDDQGRRLGDKMAKTIVVAAEDA